MLSLLFDRTQLSDFWLAIIGGILTTVLIAGGVSLFSWITATFVASTLAIFSIVLLMVLMAYLLVCIWA